MSFGAAPALPALDPGGIVELPIVFADSRKFAEEWAYRFLATALADLAEPPPAPDPSP